MDQPRVLILDTGTFPGHRFRDTITAGVPTPVITATSDDDFKPKKRAFAYEASDHAKELARTASLTNYDFVVIGNNEGQGLILADLLPGELRPRTLIVWFFDSCRSEQPRYAALGYSHFGSREEQGKWYADQLKALA